MILIMSFFFIIVAPASANVIVFDRIATVGTPVRLVFKTKGILFAQGGKLVDIYLENKKLGRIMTGGDGYGFFKYTFRNPGCKQLSAVSNGNRYSVRASSNGRRSNSPLPLVVSLSGSSTGKETLTARIRLVSAAWGSPGATADATSTARKAPHANRTTQRIAPSRYFAGCRGRSA